MSDTFNKKVNPADNDDIEVIKKFRNDAKVGTVSAEAPGCTDADWADENCRLRHIGKSGSRHHARFQPAH